MLLPTPEMNPPSGLSVACVPGPPIRIGGGLALAFFPSDILPVHVDSFFIPYALSTQSATKHMWAVILIAETSACIYYENVWACSSFRI